MMWNNSYNIIQLGFGGWILVLIFLIILINAGVMKDGGEEIKYLEA